jgi:hypothetical protein
MLAVSPLIGNAADMADSIETGSTQKQQRSATVGSRRIGSNRSVCLPLVNVCLLTLVCVAAFAAAPFSTDGISISVPNGFEGPVIQNQGQAKVVAFTKQSTTVSVNTLLQVSIFNPGPGAIPTTLSQQELSAGAQKYLLDFVKGIERRRTEYGQGEVAKLLLAGTPAAKIAWHGRIEGLSSNGVMYCVILQGKIFSFHTQDMGRESTANMREAIKSIEAITLR